MPEPPERAGGDPPDTPPPKSDGEVPDPQPEPAAGSAAGRDADGLPGGPRSRRLEEPPSRREVTRLLDEAGQGRDGAAGLLLEAVYAELRQMAAARMAAERAEHTLQPTALVHEAWLRLTGGRAGAGQADGGAAAGERGVGGVGGPWDSRAHFFGAAARAMQRILVEHARARGRSKRGGGARRLPLSVVELAEESDLETVLAVQQAVERLEQRDPRLAEIVRLRFYAGLSELEVAGLLELSDRTVRRDWALARAWLLRELQR